MRLRCLAQPNPAQAALRDRLGIVLAKRVRVHEPLSGFHAGAGPNRKNR